MGALGLLYAVKSLGFSSGGLYMRNTLRIPEVGDEETQHRHMEADNWPRGHALH